MIILQKQLQKPWLFFLPALVLYVIIVTLFYNGKLLGDEGRYIVFAENLLKGFYSPKHEINLWSGPGYPILLMPFVAFNVPLFFIVLLNAVLYYLSVILLYHATLLFASKRIAVFFSIIWASYFVAYQELPRILTEPFTCFLICFILYSFLKYSLGSKRIYGYISGFLIGFLVLTKIVFGYVLLVCIFLWVVVFFAEKIKGHLTPSLSRTRLVLAVAFLTITPYLFYTYQLTNRFFYFGNSGGMSLYWMSTPFENEYGDWHYMDSSALNSKSRFGEIYTSDLLVQNHKAETDSIMQLGAIEEDDAFKNVAIRNIKKHPFKYLRNCFANQGRLWFGFPASYVYQRDITLVRVFPNAVLFTFFIAVIAIWFINLRRLNPIFHNIILFLLLYLGASTLVSAYPRQLYVVVPVILLLSAHIIHKCIQFRFIIISLNVDQKL